MQHLSIKRSEKWPSLQNANLMNTLKDEFVL